MKPNKKMALFSCFLFFLGLQPLLPYWFIFFLLLFFPFFLPLPSPFPSPLSPPLLSLSFLLSLPRSQFIFDEVTQNLLKLPYLKVLMAFARGLLENPTLNLEPYLHQMMPPILTCMVGKRFTVFFLKVSVEK